MIGRRLWRIGDWGGASEQIGRRWEQVGSQALDQIVGTPRPGPGGSTYLPRRALVLATDPDLAAQVHAGGKAHADAILVGEADGSTVLEPVDFKWTLETADPKQVGAEVLRTLLTDPPPLLSGRLAEAMAGLPRADAPLYHDGIFIAPDHAENRAYLAPRGPLDPSWAYLCPVDALAFFEPLPGWDVGLALARAEGVRPTSVEQAERYYRLGAGTLGAMRKLAAGIFGDEPLDLDGPRELERLRRERRLRTTGDVVAYLDRALSARSELLERLREVERAMYPFALFRQDLAARGVAFADARDRRWGRLYGIIMRELSEQIRRAGRARLAAGRSEIEALAEIEAGRARWTGLARRLLDARLAALPPESRA